MKRFTVTDIDGEDWSGTYEQFRAEVRRLGLPICGYCKGRRDHDHWCSEMAKACTAVASSLARTPASVWHGDA